MDIKSFLSSGTSHVHAKEPQGNFVKSAAAIVLGIAIGASALYAGYEAANSATGRLSTVAQMPYPQDDLSRLYQALVSPESNSSLRVVSTKSASLSAMMDAMPLGMALINSGLNEQIAKYASVGSATSVVTNGGFLNKRESVCVVSALEVVGDLVDSHNGVEYVNMAASDYGLVDELSLIAGNITPHEAGLLHVLHELSHCQSRFKSARSFSATDNKLLSDFNTSFGEVEADLSVILYYASREGRFDNGLLAVSALRGKFHNEDHTTVDMLEAVLGRLNPSDFVGMSPHELLGASTDIMDDAWADADFKGELKLAFMQDYYEGAVLAAMVRGNTLQLDQLNGPVLDYFKKLEPEFSYDVSAKASKLIDRALNHGLRNPDLQRSLGAVAVKDVESLAHRMGVELSGEQLLKARFLDPEFTPVGFKGEVGVAGVEALREVNYVAELEAQAKLNAHQKALPRFN